VITAPKLCPVFITH